MGGPCPLRSGRSKRKTQRVTTRLAHVATPTISLSITASCPANIKHSNLQLPRDSSVAVPHIQRLIPRKEGAPRNDHTMNGLSYCPATIKSCVFIMVSDGLRSTLTWSKFNMLPDPPGTLCTTYAHRNYAHRNYTHRNCARCARRMTAPKTTLCMPPPLSLNPWIRPCLPTFV